MPLPRTALYGQGENLHIAVWPGSDHNTKDITRFIARESRSFVISVSSLMNKTDIPKDTPHFNKIVKKLLAKKVNIEAKDDEDKLALYMKDCSMENIKVFSPSINHSSIDTVVDANGDRVAVVVTGPVFVNAKTFVEESDVGVIALQVRSDVPDIADNGDVGGVNADV